MGAEREFRDIGQVVSIACDMRTLVTLGCLCCAAVVNAAESFEDRVRNYLLSNPEVILEAMEILAEREARDAMAARIAVHGDLFEDPAVHGLGAPDAPIRVIEFFDYKCIPCKAMHPGLVDLVAKTPEIRIEMRHLPILTPGSERGARFALAVRALEGDAAYERVHNAIWAATGALNARLFQSIADREGLSLEAIEGVMESDSITARITRNRDIAIDLELLGTPAFVTKTGFSVGQANIDALAETWLSQ